MLLEHNGDLVEAEVSITTADGRLPTFTARPAGDGPLPIVVFYMDALGIREELRDMVRRIAREGYLCVLPDLFYRTGLVRFDLSRGNAPVLPVARAIIAGLTNDMVASDTAGIIAWAQGQPMADPSRMGCVGHCMSGRFVATAMSRYPQHFAAGISMYGTGIVTEGADSPHLALTAIRGELYIAFGGQDALLPEAMREQIRAALEAAGARYEIEVFPDAGHGFAFVCRPAYEPQAAEASWKKTFALLARTLKHRT